MQGIYQKEKREKQRRAWTMLISEIPNKLQSLPMPTVISTILTRLSDVWHTYRQIWYVPFIWSFAWYSYWIIHDIVVWNKPLAQLNMLNYVGATASAIFILAASPIRRRLQKGVVFAKTTVTVEDGKPIRHKTMLKPLFLSDVSKREIEELARLQAKVIKELARLQAKVTTLEQEKETLNSRLVSIGNELSLTKEQLKNAPNPEYVKTLENKNRDLTTVLQAEKERANSLTKVSSDFTKKLLQIEKIVSEVAIPDTSAIPETIHVDRGMKPQKEVASTSTSNEITGSTAQKGHATIQELIECPNCYPELKRLISPKILKEYGESLKGHERVICKECGLTVKKEDAVCPACGKSKAEYSTER
jgi:cell division septum initiation protein DivIVA